MAEGKKLSTKAKVGIGIAVAVLVVGLVLLIWWLARKKDEATGGDDTGRTDDSGGGSSTTTPEAPISGPILPPSPDPMAPTTVPTKGKYYIVHAGDSDALICQKAGFPAGLVYEARVTMRDHWRNAWIPKTGSGTAKRLNLFAGWAPMPGKETLSWAHQTEQLGLGGHKWPIVYVPSDAEVPG